MDVIRKCAETRTPMLGVCLGHQALGVVYGATVDRAPELLHGKTSQVRHTGAGVLKDLPAEFTATRYHSLTVVPDTIPADVFEVTGRTEIRHRDGHAPPRAAAGRRPVPPRVRAHRGRPPDAGRTGSPRPATPSTPARVDELERATKALQKAAVA